MVLGPAVLGGHLVLGPAVLGGHVVLGQVVLGNTWSWDHTCPRGQFKGETAHPMTLVRDIVMVPDFPSQLRDKSGSGLGTRLDMFLHYGCIC